FLLVELYERMTGAGGRIALAATLVAAGVVTFGFWIASSSRAVGFLYFLYLWPGLVTTLVTLQFWTLLGDAFTITQAKRTYGAIGVGSVAGGIAGAAIASGLSAIVEPRHLLIAAALGLPLAGVVSLLLRLTRQLPSTPDQGETKPDGPHQGAL